MRFAANGCKLFQCFGGDSDPVSTPVQNRPDPTGSWWSKIFSSTKKPSSSTGTHQTLKDLNYDSYRVYLISKIYI